MSNHLNASLEKTLEKLNVFARQYSILIEKSEKILCGASFDQKGNMKMHIEDMSVHCYN